MEALRNGDTEVSYVLNNDYDKFNIVINNVYFLFKINDTGIKVTAHPKGDGLFDNQIDKMDIQFRTVDSFAEGNHKPLLDQTLYPTLKQQED